MQNKKMLYSLLGCLLILIVLWLVIQVKEEESLKDLEDFMITLIRKKVVVESIPVFKKVTAVVYAPGAKRNPFEEVVMQSKNKKTTEADSYNILSHYPLSSLKLVGMVEYKGELYAMIETPEHKSYQVKRGHILGDQGMQLVEISKEGVVVAVVNNKKWDKNKAIHIDFEKVPDVVTMDAGK